MSIAFAETLNFFGFFEEWSISLTFFQNMVSAVSLHLCQNLEDRIFPIFYDAASMMVSVLALPGQCRASKVTMSMPCRLPGWAAEVLNDGGPSTATAATWDSRNWDQGNWQYSLKEAAEPARLDLGCRFGVFCVRISAGEGKQPPNCDLLMLNARKIRQP